MPDDLSKKGPQDRSRINSDEDYSFAIGVKNLKFRSSAKGGGGEGWQLSRSCRERVAGRATRNEQFGTLGMLGLPRFSITRRVCFE